MIIAVVPVKDYQSAKQQIAFSNNKADGIELRLDFLQPFDLNIIAALRQECSLPVVFTLRKKSQGGFYQHDETQRLQSLTALCQLNPDYIDLEYDISKNFLQEIHSRYPNIKLICSYHDFIATSQDLQALLYSMLHPCFYSYKIAAQARCTLDALRMLQFVNTFRKKFILTGICMGEDGQSTRILSPIVGNAMNYASVSRALAVNGQLTLDELLTVYHVRKLNTESKIYALLGNPVDMSAGHILHNQAIECLNQNAVYIKLRTDKESLPQVIDQTRRLPFCGFSITMPLKTAIVPLLDDIGPQTCSLQAINSVLVDAEKYIGFNTDGAGAVQAICEHVEMAAQKIVILGAGGAARAIASEAIQHKAEVIIMGRTIQKAKGLAREIGCEGMCLSRVKHLLKMDYTVLINTLPSTAYSSPFLREWLRPSHLLPGKISMDIVYNPVLTSFLQAASDANNLCIFGYKMYINQALMQIKRWFAPDERQSYEIRNRMEQYFLKGPLSTSDNSAVIL